MLILYTPRQQVSSHSRLTSSSRVLCFRDLVAMSIHPVPHHLPTYPLPLQAGSFPPNPPEPHITSTAISSQDKALDLLISHRYGCDYLAHFSLPIPPSITPIYPHTTQIPAMPPFGRRNRRREPYAWIAEGGGGHVLGNIPQGGNPVAAAAGPGEQAGAVGARGGPPGRLFDEAGKALGAAPPGAVVRVRGGAGGPAGEPARAAGGRAAAERRAERAMERAAERAMERAVEGPAERAMERRVEGPAERAVIGAGGGGGRAASTLAGVPE